MICISHCVVAKYIQRDVKIVFCHLCWNPEISFIALHITKYVWFVIITVGVGEVQNRSYSLHPFFHSPGRTATRVNSLCWTFVKHILIDCVDFVPMYQRYNTITSMRDLFDRVFLEIILVYLISCIFVYISFDAKHYL